MAGKLATSVQEGVFWLRECAPGTSIAAAAACLPAGRVRQQARRRRAPSQPGAPDQPGPLTHPAAPLPPPPQLHHGNQAWPLPPLHGGREAVQGGHAQRALVGGAARAGRAAPPRSSLHARRPARRARRPNDGRPPAVQGPNRHAAQPAGGHLPRLGAPAGRHGGWRARGAGRGRGVGGLTPADSLRCMQPPGTPQLPSRAAAPPAARRPCWLTA